MFGKGYKGFFGSERNQLSKFFVPDYEKPSSGGAGVTSFNARTGVVTLTNLDVFNAIGYVPYNGTNPNNYVGGNGTQNYLLKYGLGGSIVGNSQLFDDGTNVGIGTATPGYKLDVNGIINTSSNYSYYIGGNAFVSTDSSFLNTSVGYQAGFSNTTSAGVFLGRQAGKLYSAGSPIVAIGYQAYSSQTNNSGQSVAIGAYSLMSENGGNGNNTAVGFASVSNITNAIEITAFGAYALYDSTAGQRQLAIGAEALRYSNGDFNFGIGRRAGYDVTSGTNNMFIGNNSGWGITTGSNNLIIGYNITGLAANTTNAVIIADGNGSKFISNLYGNDTSIIIGRTTAHGLGNNLGGCVVVGSSSLQNYVAPYGNAWANVVIGYGNFSNLTGGIGNIALGTNINQLSSTTYNHTIGIGTDVVITASNQMVVGGQFSGIDNVYLGHGVASPDATLYVGKIGINTTSPSYNFDVNGKSIFRDIMYVETLQSPFFPGSSSVNIQSNVNVTSRGEIGIAYSSFVVNTPSTLTTPGCNLATFYNNGVEKFSVDKDGNIYSNLQIGNAGLSSGKMYKDTAANILANGDYVVGMKA